MTTTTKRPRSLTLGKSIKTAANASLPAVAGAGGSIIGTLAARWAAARVNPTKYAENALIPIAAGTAGAVVGGALPLMLLSSTRTKSAAEKTYKATYPLGIIGILIAFIATTVAPYTWGWLKAKLPTAMNMASPTPTSRQLGGTMVGAKVAMRQLASPASSTTTSNVRQLQRASGLTPDQRNRLEARAAGLKPQQRNALERGSSGRSVRFAV